MNRLIPFILLLTSAIAIAAPPDAPAWPADPVRALKDGNARYVADAPLHPREDQARRIQTAPAQQPFAAILACADSRVPPELAFDQGIGDLFVIRVAGNVAGADETGSLEYAVEHFHVPLLLVLGHSSCGAVQAAVDRPPGLPVRVAQLIAPIAPAVEQARAADPTLTGPPLVAAAVRANVMQQVRTLLRSSDIIRDAVRAGHLQVIGAVYDLPTGTVTFLGPHPDQPHLLSTPAESQPHPTTSPRKPRHRPSH